MSNRSGGITDEMGKLSIEPWKESLNEHHQELRTGIIVCNFSPELHKLPLTEIERARIEDKPDNVSRVDELIRILLTKTKEHFDMFCSVLEENGYKHWADRLRGEANRYTYMPVPWHPYLQQLAHAASGRMCIVYRGGVHACVWPWVGGWLDG